MQAALKKDRAPDELHAQWLQEWYAIKTVKGMEPVELTGFSKIPTVSLSHADYLTLTLCTISCDTTDSILMLSASGKIRLDEMLKRRG